MKLNPDCIRDLLMDIEANTDPENTVIYDFSTPTDGILVGYAAYNDGTTEIAALTPEGHRFLADVRSDPVWSRTKAVASKVGAWSLDTLSKIASNVVSDLIKMQGL